MARLPSLGSSVRRQALDLLLEQEGSEQLFDGDLVLFRQILVLKAPEAEPYAR